MPVPNIPETTATSEKEKTVIGDWSLFDAIYCISLAHRLDRRVAAEKEFARAGLASRVEFFCPTKHPSDCEEGIYTSHLACLRQGLAKGARNILIFEDDVQFSGLSTERMGQMAVFLRSGVPWQVFFLGCMVSRSEKTTFPGVRRIAYRSLAHAYAVTAAFAEVIVTRHPWQNIPYDDFLRDLHSRQMYVLYPAVAYQSAAASDNDVYLPLDRLRRIFGGLRRLQRLDEWYHYHQRAIFSAHALFLLALLGWFLLR